MPNALAKIRAAAKRIQRENPRTSYQSALKKAGLEYRQGKISGTKKKKVGATKRKAKSSKPRRPRKVGAVADQTLAQSMAETKKKLVARLGWAMVNRAQATTASARARYAEEVDTLRRRINALS